MTRAAFGILVLLAAAVSAAAEGAPVNEMCPVMTDQRVDPAITVEVEGKTIGFCCLRCRKTFREDPSPYLHLVPGFESAAPPAADPAATTGAAADGPRGLARAVRFAGRFHVVLVHFPIALVLAAALAEILLRLRGIAWLAGAARFSLLTAAAGALVTAPIGWAAAAFSSFPGAEDVLFLHRWTGTAGAAIVLAAAALGELRRRRPGLGVLYGLALAAAVLLVGLTGHLGGTLVYGPDHYVW